MKYQLDFDLNYLKVDKTTGECHDEIYMTGFGMNEFGKIDVMPIRRIRSSDVGSFTPDEDIFDGVSDTVRGSTIIGDSTLLSTVLPGRRHLNYQIWLWIIESDDANLLRSEFAFTKSGLENLVEGAIYKLRRDGFPEATRCFQAMANNIMRVHDDIRVALYEHGSKFEIFTPITKFVNCNYFVPNPSEIILEDFAAGEYAIDNEINSQSFRFINSADNNFVTRYWFSNYWKLTVSGTPGLPVHP